MLCGHTHGGQVPILPIGPSFAPVEDKRFIAGLRAWRGRQIYVTRGVGNIGGMRFRCRPEIGMLTLSSGKRRME
jgi:predicted MPP superfamily phosphohydrolase